MPFIILIYYQYKKAGCDEVYRVVSFVLVFLLLACTITAISAVTYEPPQAAAPDRVDGTGATELPTQVSETTPPIPQVEHDHSLKTASYTPRMTAPDTDDPRYYSDDNIFYEAGYGMPNCTCYAWGRAYEINGEAPELSPYDACTWYDYNAANGVYDYGEEPEQGAIACWAYADGGPGHVAVVEQVEGDRVLLSNSAYSGDTFYLDTVSADDPSQGRDNWIFQGYIYVTEPKNRAAL